MRALVIEDGAQGYRCDVIECEPEASDDGDVLVAVEYSGVNFKDVMVATPSSRVRRRERLVGGVDAAGTIVHATPDFAAGERVAVHGGSLGVARDGGFAELLFAPPSAVVRLPEQLSTRDAMVIGTAGFTAMASVLALEDYGLAAQSEVLVTGATGGVGSQAVRYLTLRGYVVTASTGSTSAAPWLRSLGADEVVGREDVTDRPDRVLGTERWDGAVDCVGGATLAHVLRSLRYGGAVAASGLVASADLVTTVYPFITRGVALLGVDAVLAPSTVRKRVWEALALIASEVDFSLLTDRVVGLAALPDALEVVRRGDTQGRVLVDVRAASL